MQSGKIMADRVRVGAEDRQGLVKGVYRISIQPTPLADSFARHVVQKGTISRALQVGATVNRKFPKQPALIIFCQLYKRFNLKYIAYTYFHFP